MDWLYYTGIIGSIILMIAGFGGTLRFIHIYQEERTSTKLSNVVSWVSWAVGILICLSAFIFIPSGIKRWLIVGGGLLCIVIPMIICCIIDRCHGQEMFYNLTGWTHLLFFLAVLCIPAGRISMMKISNAYIDYVYRHSDFKVIDYIKTTTLPETDYQWVEGSTGEQMLPAGKKETEWIVIVATDQTEILVCRKAKGVDYEKLYPQGDVITLYKGEVFVP